MKILKALNHWLLQYRYEIYFFTIILSLFSNLFFPSQTGNSHQLTTLFFLLNLISGINLIARQKRGAKIFYLLWFVVLFLFINNFFEDDERGEGLSSLLIFFLIYSFFTIEIIRQIWNEQTVSKNVILGVMSGYISLGLVGFFIFLILEIYNPNSFDAVVITANNAASSAEDLLYFSFITLLTIGYGDIVPSTTIAQKATMLLGLSGQFYMVIITAVIVGKYINDRGKKEEK
ncbi:potassium channel family protein [Aureivirga sp. CE67]|uniref:potassium channel family protein n=1 Tax=Aureivirga sp. CE67 TaxID=1788983 RepID=UPI0018C954D2|nr:potassium channel family protein [Aureivirga sp. CE67]